MTPLKRPLAWLAGLTLGFLAALILAPSTGWMVRLQTLAQFQAADPVVMARWETMATGSNASEPGEKRFLTPLRDTALRHPNDYLIQLGYIALAHQQSGVKVNLLRELESRFPNSPSLYANILRYASQGQVIIHRREEFLFSEQPVPHYFESRKKPSERDLAAFLYAAEAGERLDPENAFFPLMHAAGLYAANRDAEAAAAIVRAGQKPRWREYYDDEYRGIQRLLQIRYGRQSALHNCFTFFSIIFPHLLPMRGAARLAIYQAMQEEKAGRRGEGLKIRQAVAHLGSRMNSDAPSAIGTLVGQAIFMIAVSRPEGAPVRKFPPQTPADQQRTKNLQAYMDYLNRIGHSQEAQYLQETHQRMEQRISLLQSRRGDEILSGAPLLPLIICWGFALYLLSQSLWMLISGAAAHLLSRFEMPEQRRMWGTLFIAAGLLLILSTQCLRSESLLNSLGKTLTWLSSLHNFSQGGAAGDFAKLFLTGIWILPPLFMIAAMTLVSYARRRTSLCADIVNGFRRGVFATGCLFALLYGGLVIYSVRLENRVNYAVERTLQHEGRFYAELTGQQWLP